MHHKMSDIKKIVQRLAQDLLYNDSFDHSNFKYYRDLNKTNFLKFGDEILSDIGHTDDLTFQRYLALYMTAAKLNYIKSGIVINFLQKLMIKINNEDMIITIAFLFYEYIFMMKDDESLFRNIDLRYLQYAEYMARNNTVSTYQNDIYDLCEKYQEFIDKTEGKDFANKFFDKYSKKLDKFMKKLLKDKARGGKEFELLKSINLEELGREILENVDFAEYQYVYIVDLFYKYIGATLIRDKNDIKEIQRFLRNLMMKDIVNNGLILLISRLFRDYIIDMKEELELLGVDSRYLKYAGDLTYKNERQKSENIEQLPEESIDAIFKSIFGEERASSSAAASSSDLNPVNLLLTQNQVQSNRRLQHLTRQLNLEDYSSQKDVYKFGERNGKN
jgi:hypothetical protein